MENSKYALVDKSVLDAVMQDCRDAAMKVSDNLVEAHQLACMLYESAANPGDKYKPVLIDKNKLISLNTRIENNIKAGKKPYANLNKEEKIAVLLSGPIDKQNNKMSDTDFDTVPVAKKTNQTKNIFDTWTKK